MEIENQFFVHSDYSKGLLLIQLMDLKTEIEKGMRRNRNVDTLGHWRLCLEKINTALLVTPTNSIQDD